MRKFITTQEAARRLGVGPRRIIAMIRAGLLPAEKLGRDWAIDPQQVKTVVRRKAGRPRKEEV